MQNRSASFRSFDPTRKTIHAAIGLGILAAAVWMLSSPSRKTASSEHVTEKAINAANPAIPRFESKQVRRDISINRSARMLDRAENDADSVENGWLSRLRAFPAGHVLPGARMRAFERWKQMSSTFRAAQTSATSPASPQWTPLGPQPETGVSAGNQLTLPCSGRVTAIAISPADPNTIYIGGAEGGVWKTQNGGTNWTPLTDFQPSLSIGALAIDPANANTIYAGTGEQNHSPYEYSGVGILKSTDGGSTWSLFGESVLSGHTIGSLAVDPANSEILLAATSLGIYQSQDAGSTWRRVLATDTSADVVLFDPSNSGTAYASVGDGPSAYAGVYKSADGGSTWKTINGSGANTLPVAQAGRIGLAISHSTLPILYAGVAAVGEVTPDMIGFYKSVDGGANWTKVSNAGYCPEVNGRGQCYYNNIVAVHPSNPNLLIGGGIDLLVSTDGGATWTRQTNIHSDQHAVVFSADGTRAFIGDDGGVFTANTTNSSAQTYAWSSLNSTIMLAQFYPGISVSPVNANIAFGGTQDNNVLAFSGTMQWTSVSGGDGTATAIDPQQPNNVYIAIAGSSAQVNPIFKSTQGGLPGTFSPADSGIDLSETLPFPNFLAIDPEQPSILYFTGPTQLYQSTNGAASWTKLPQNLTRGIDDLCTIAVAPSDSNTVYTGSCDGAVYRTHSALSGTASTWANIATGLPLKSVTHIAVDPASPTTAYVTLSGNRSGHVFMTTSAGGSWNDITGNLPDTSVNDLLVDRDLSHTLYVATDLGVYWTNTTGQLWSVLGAGLPNSPVLSLAFYEPGRVLFAATHGRGMWQVPVPANANLIPLVSSVSPSEISLNGSVSLTVTGQNFVADSIVFWSGAQRATTFVSSTQLSVTLASADLSADALIPVTVFTPGPGGGQSQDQYVKVGPAPAFYPAGVLNSGGMFPAYALAPGSIAIASGVNLNSASVSAPSSTLSVALGGTVVTILDSTLDIPYSGRIFSAALGQVEFQIPWEIRTGDTAVLHPVFNGSEGPGVSTYIVPFAPGIFVTDSSNQGAIEIASTGALAAPSSAPYPGAQPAKPGDLISIYCTGLGAVINQPADGSPASADPLSRTLTTPIVLINGKSARVTFSGLAPGYVGLNQIDVVVPAGTPAGAAVPLMITDGNGNYSNTVFFAVAAGSGSSATPSRNSR